ncbi:MAG: alpha-2-macroglobulin family protein [Thermoanaerobaculia bacterium]
MVRHRNLPALYFRAYPVDLAAQLASAEFRGYFPSDDRDIERLISGATPAAEWSVELPPTRDFSSHRTYVTPPLRSSGLYLIVASAEKSFRHDNNRRVALPFVLSDLVLLEEGNGQPWDVRLVDGETGRPAAGVDVALYRNTWRIAPQRLRSATTDAEGRAAISVPDGAEAGQMLLVARRGSDVALSQRWIGYHPPPEGRSDSLLFTDRAIYRPLQKVAFKVLGYRAGTARGDLKPSRGTPIAVWLSDPNGEKVSEIQLTTNDFGTAAGDLTIPAGRLLGEWSLQTSLGGMSPVRVEEYKRPTFEVELAPPAAALRLNRAADLAGSARYYFGLPVASGSVAWRVSRESELPWWWRWWGGGDSNDASEAEIIATGTTQLAADGSFHIAFTPAADEKDKASGLTYRYSLMADVTDDGGETRTGERAVRLGWVAVETSVEPARPLFVEDQAVAFALRRHDLDDVARAGSGSWRLVELAQPAQAPLAAELPVHRPGRGELDPFATPGDDLRPRWTGAVSVPQTLALFADGREIAHGETTHDAKGVGAVSWSTLAAGAYRLHYETRDPFGEIFRTQTDFVVAGHATPLAVPAEVGFDRATAQPGEVSHLWVHSGLTAAPAEVELWRGDALVWRRAVILAGSRWIDVPIAEADRGGLAARVTLVADHQLVSAGSTLDVPWKNKELTVEFASFRDKLVPGAKETFRVTVKDASGRAVEAGAAELLASMYDRSLDLFAPFSVARPLALFPSGTGFQMLSANLGASGALWQREDEWQEFSSSATLSGDAFVDISPWGIGGPGYGVGGPLRRMYKGADATMVVEGAMAPAAAAPLEIPAPQSMNEARQRSADAVSLADVAGGVAGGAGRAAAAPVALRSNFAETAFWQPQLLTGSDGSATIEFTVPDSVTSWRVWVAALSKTFASGYVEKNAESVKDLLVRPYLPRFLREGDRADLKVVVNDAGQMPLSGEATLEIFDPETETSLLSDFGLTAETARRSFQVESGKGIDLTFALVAPRRVGAVAFKVIARAGNLSDGELRPLPLLPSRIHLSQSRFVTVKGAERREMTFEDMKRKDATRINEQMVVTVDGQLFYSMLDALPYLVEYPYECTEQTLSRFVSTGMLSSLFSKYPAVAKVAEEMSKREAPLERFDASDPNRRMALEETPWLRESRGGEKSGEEFLRVLDPAVSRAQRADALAKLQKAQLPNGGFPWFAGGPPSPYMTLYLMAGMARAVEFHVEVPKDLVQGGWRYLAREAKSDWLPNAVKDDCCWELLTYLNYVASSYPDASWTDEFLTDADRRTILAFSFKHWKDHQPLLKFQLALTLHRMNRQKDAELVLASVMDSAKTTRDEGTFWLPEDRAWLWYNDAIETHAWALRAVMEVTPSDPRREGLVQWLFLNKKLNHWKSTRATAEVLYSLAAYLEATQTLAVKESATVAAAGQTTTFVFEPDRFTGKKNQILIPGANLDGEAHPADATVTVEKTTPGMLFASATWQFSTEQLPAEARGDLFGVTRHYFKRVKSGTEVTLVPITEKSALAVGDEVEVQLSLTAKAAAEYVHLRDPRPAGLEPDRLDSGWKWDLGIARYEETRDSGANFFFEQLPAGEYTFKYRLRANLAGEFRNGPAEVQSIYAPEFVAYSTGEILKISPH